MKQNNNLDIFYKQNSMDTNNTSILNTSEQQSKYDYLFTNKKYTYNDSSNSYKFHKISNDTDLYIPTNTESEFINTGSYILTNYTDSNTSSELSSNFSLSDTETETSYSCTEILNKKKQLNLPKKVEDGIIKTN